MASVASSTLAGRGRQVFARFDSSGSLISHHVNDEVREFTSALQDQAQRFKIWAIDLGLLVPGHGSLDYRVRETESLQRTLVTYLDDLSLDLKELSEIVSFPTLLEYQASISEQADATPENEDDSSDSGDLQHGDYVSISLESIADVINRLFTLSTRIRDPTTRLISSRAREFRNVDEDSGLDLVKAYRHWDYCHVQAVFASHALRAPDEQFEDALDVYTSQEAKEEIWWHSTENCNLCRSRQAVHAEPVSETASQRSSSSSSSNSREIVHEEDGDIFTHYLIQRLSRANAQRRQQLMYWKAHHRKQVERTHMALAPPAHKGSYGRINLAQVPDKEAVNEGDEAALGPIQPSAPTITTATRLDPAISFLHDTRSTASVS